MGGLRNKAAKANNGLMRLCTLISLLGDLMSIKAMIFLGLFSVPIWLTM